MNATKAELLHSIKRNESILALVDVRSPQQMKVPSKIENAVNISNIPNAMKLSPADFKTKFGVAYPEIGSTICLHCNSGTGSGKTLADLVENHAELAEKFRWRNVSGGVMKWNADNMKTNGEKGNGCSIV